MSSSRSGDVIPKKLKYLRNDSSAAPPMVVSFANGVPSSEVVSSLSFFNLSSVQTGKERPRLVWAGSNGITVEGRVPVTSETTSVPGRTKYVIGLLDRNTRECQIMDASGLVVLHQSVEKQASIHPTMASGSDTSAVDPRAVIHEFGSKRKQRLLVKRDTYQTTVDRIKGQDAVQAAISENLASEPTTEHIQEAYAASRNLPPHDASAILPQHAYPIGKLVSSAELEECDTAVFGDYSDAALAQASKFSYVRKMARRIADMWSNAADSTGKEQAEVQARYLLYVHYMLLYYSNPRALFPPKQKPAEGGGAAAVDGSSAAVVEEILIPSAIASRFSSRFTVKSENPDGKSSRRIRSKSGELLLLGWILCVAMHLSSFTLRDEIYDIAHDLKLTSASILAHCKELGFLVERNKKRSTPEGDALSASSADSLRYTAVLKCPLQIPGMPVKRGQKRN
eukprot:ANDGO_05314.mRNA.1 hypothetical protein PHYSODRAFT_500692